MPRLLVFRGSPRSNIKEVEEHNARLNCDVLCVRYMAEHDAYRLARDYFLKYTEYDYFVICNDDAVLLPVHIELLRRALEIKQYEVLTGHANVTEGSNLQNITDRPIIVNGVADFPHWMKHEELPEANIFPVYFVGFALTAIRRDVIKKIPFAEKDGYKGKTNFKASKDVIFSLHCIEQSVPMFCDKRINIQHLSKHGDHQVGKRTPEVCLFKGD